MLNLNLKALLVIKELEKTSATKKVLPCHVIKQVKVEDFEKNAKKH